MLSILFIRKANGNNRETRLCLPYIPYIPGYDDVPNPGFGRTQYSITAYVSLSTDVARTQLFQGSLGLDLFQECLTDGQLYMTFSSTTHPKNLFVGSDRNFRIMKNVLCFSVLNDQLNDKAYRATFQKCLRMFYILSNWIFPQSIFEFGKSGTNSAHSYFFDSIKKSPHVLLSTRTRILVFKIFSTFKPPRCSLYLSIVVAFSYL